MGDAFGGVIDARCCECWKEGCGPIDPCLGFTADGLEAITPAIEMCADCIWIFGSPLAFPFIFCFSPNPEAEQQPSGPSGGWEMTMMQTPLGKPLTCCFACFCPCCAQWVARRAALHNDMSKYKLWQGQHDGPQCCARRCPGAPITIQSGTYGESNCPHLFLCFEICCLGGVYSLCCAHRVTRRMVREEYQLGKDPTEIRMEKCVHFFGVIMNKCCMAALVLRVCSCLCGCCAPDSEGAQECSANGKRASAACFRIGRILWRGIQSTRVIAMSCMTAQQMKQLETEPSIPVKEVMER